MDMAVGAYDNYFTGNLTDTIEGITVAPLGERYLGVFDADGQRPGRRAGGRLRRRHRRRLRDGRHQPERDRAPAREQRLPTDGDYHGGAPVGKDATQVVVTP